MPSQRPYRSGESPCAGNERPEGERLSHRTTRTGNLTAAGELLQTAVTQSLEQLEAAIENVSWSGAAARRTLMVGTTPQLLHTPS
jgi:DNA-binding transcriptional LysR family regulator